MDQQRFWEAYQVVQQAISLEIPAGGEGVHLVDEVGSTNQMVWERLEQTNASEIVVIARSQTAGRGQRGRQWQSEPGGLYLSVGITPTIAAVQAPELTLCSAWGIATALRQIPSRLSGVETFIPVQIKWLNDLVLGGRKLGGILTETRVQQEQVTKAVVGVGINWTNSVPETGIRLQEFLEKQPDPLIESLEMLAAIALFGIRWGVYRREQEGMATLLQDYVDLLAHRDRPLPIQGQLATIVGITPAGELRVRLESAEMPNHLLTKETERDEILIKPGTISLGYPL